MSRAPWLITLAFRPLRFMSVKASTGLPSKVPNTDRLTAMILQSATATVPIRGLVALLLPQAWLARSNLAQQPFMLFLIMKLPGPLRSGHHIEIIEVVAMQRRTRMIPLGDERHVAVMDGDCLIERSVICIDALEGEALAGPDPMVVNFFEHRFVRKIVLVVLVGRIR